MEAIDTTAPNPVPRPREERVRAAQFSVNVPIIAATIVILAGTGIRIWLASLPLGAFDGDEATTGVMVRQILHGHLYTYMAGQTYNGALEQYLQAFVWLIAPQNIWTLRSVDFCISAVTALVVYKTAGLYFRSPWRALTAMSFYYLGPYFNVWKGIHSHGAYAVGQLVAVLALWAAAHLKGSTRDRCRDCLLLGLTVGLAGWLSWTSFFLVIPACLWAIPTMRKVPSRRFWTAVGALVGALPVVAWSIGHHQLPGLGGPQKPESVIQRVANLTGPITREALGLGYRYGKPGLPIWLQTFVVVALAVTVACYSARRLRALFGTLDGAAASRRPSDVLLFIPPIVLIAFAASRYSWWTGDPRYLFTTYPALALAAAGLRAPRGRKGIAAGITLVLLSATSTVSTISAHANEGPHAESACLSQVARWLAAHDITHVYSDYWTGMPLQMVAGSHLVVGPVSGGRAKFPYQRRTVDNAPSVYYVAGHILDPMDEEQDNVNEVRQALATNHIQARETPIACTILFSDFTPNVRPWQIGLGSE